MATVASKMTALANEVREISGATNKLSIDAMTTHLDTVNAEITEQESLIADMNEMLDHLGAESVGGSGGEIESVDVENSSGQYIFVYLFNAPTQSVLTHSNNGMIIPLSVTASITKGSYIIAYEKSGGFPVVHIPSNAVEKIWSDTIASCYRVNADCRFVLND